MFKQLNPTPSLQLPIHPPLKWSNERGFLAHSVYSVLNHVAQSVTSATTQPKAPGCYPGTRYSLRGSLTTLA